MKFNPVIHTKRKWLSDCAKRNALINHIIILALALPRAATGLFTKTETNATCFLRRADRMKNSEVLKKKKSSGKGTTYVE